MHFGISVVSLRLSKEGFMFQTIRHKKKKKVSIHLPCEKGKKREKNKHLILETI